MNIRHLSCATLLIMATSLAFASDPAPEPTAAPPQKTAVQPAPRLVKAPKAKRPPSRKSHSKKVSGSVTKKPGSALPQAAIVPASPLTAPQAATQKAENRWMLYSYP